MEDLIVKSIKGDKDSFIDLISSMQSYLRKIALCRLKNAEDAEDAVQETIIKAYKYINKLENPQYFKTWITKILINECNQIYSKKHPEYDFVENLDSNLDGMQNSKNIDEINNEIDFNLLINDLKDDEKEILILHHKYNYSPSQISKMLDMNVNTVKSKILRSHNKLRKILPLAIIIICIVTISSAIAIHIIKKLFNNSNYGIDKAVENGYVQNVDMDYIYYDDLGVKVDYLLVDNQNIDISFVYNYKENTNSNIKLVKMLDYTIKDENSNIIFSSQIHEDLCNNTLYTESNQTIIDNTTIKNSYLITTPINFDHFSKMYFDIKSINIDFENDSSKTIHGNWNFSIDLDTKFVTRQSETYNISSSPYVKNAKAELTDTSLTIELELYEEINIDYFRKIESKILKDSNHGKFKVINCFYTENALKLTYSITKYDNINTLFLYICFNENKYINLTLTK